MIVSSGIFWKQSYRFCAVKSRCFWNKRAKNLNEVWSYGQSFGGERKTMIGAVRLAGRALKALSLAETAIELVGSRLEQAHAEE